ncbi:MAG: type II methionyl aminopeptidase [Candidatus Micrarchaeia archaeon]
MAYDYNYEDWREAGALSFKAINYAKTLAKPGAKLIDIAEATEKMVYDNGQKTAFPVNLSINEAAAHYTPKAGDLTELDENAVLKIDFGARKNKGAGDCALTVDMSGSYAKLVEASEQALENALSKVRAGAKVSEIGREIEQTIKGVSDKFNPIRNLGGHGITETDLHADIFIPNFDNGDDTVLQEGEIAAIEPFVTTGEGYVEDSETVEIFQKVGDAQPRSQQARQAAQFIDSEFGTYPFALRWLVKHMGSEFAARRALSELGSLGVLDSFPVLVERSKGVVAQTEKSFIVQKDSCEVLTK